MTTGHKPHGIVSRYIHRPVFNRSWELSHQLLEANVTAAWILLSASLRAEDDCKLASALQVRIDVVVRDQAITVKPQNVNVEVIECLSLEAAVLHANSFKPQIIYVKTYAEATKVRPK